MAHLKKRKLEAEAKSKQQLLNSKKSAYNNQPGVAQDMDTADSTAKRRRKCIRDDDARKCDGDFNKNITLPQKKRAFAQTNSDSAVRKPGKNSDEPEDDETLIRETEAALKSLSGSWPGSRGSMYNRTNSEEDRYESNFENLFEEKKDNPKLSPSSISTSSTTSNDTGCSLKDVITLRGQQDRRNSTLNNKHPLTKNRKDNNYENLENDCSNHLNLDKHRATAGRTKVRPQEDPRNERYARYQQPDFNELVDESSNELEIDMSEPATDKEDKGERDKDRVAKNSASPNNLRLYTNYQRQYNSESIKVSPSGSPLASSPFSVTSAFKPPNPEHSKARINQIPGTIPPIGPFPAAATFVGYPTPGPVMPRPVLSPTIVEEKHSSLLQLKSPKEEIQREPTNTLSNKSPSAGLTPVASPDSKQYTILQPAGVGSRAASAIQDIAREGVVSVAAVSNSSGGTASANTPKGSSTSPSTNGPANPTSTNDSGTLTNNTSTSSSTVDDSGSANAPQDSIKMTERPSFEGNRPPLSMSPSSIGRGK